MGIILYYVNMIIKIFSRKFHISVIYICHDYAIFVKVLHTNILRYTNAALFIFD